MAFEWFRSGHGAPTDNKFLLIAKRAQVVPGMVSAVYWALLDFASQNEPRGSVEGFDTETYAEWAGWEEHDVIAIIAALTVKQAIIDGRIVAWEKRQPKREDPTATERQQKRRASLRDSNESNDSNTPVTQCHAMSQNVTPRSEKIREDQRDDPLAPDLASQRMAAIDAIRQAGTVNADVLSRFDDMWPELVQSQRIDWIYKALDFARAKNATIPSAYAMGVLANSLMTNKEPGYVNGSRDADSRPRVPAPPPEELAAADARQAAYERQAAEELARAGRLAA